MTLNEYIKKVLKPRKTLYLEYADSAKNYKLELSQTVWLSMADEIDIIIRELQDLVLDLDSKRNKTKINLT